MNITMKTKHLVLSCLFLFTMPLSILAQEKIELPFAKFKLGTDDKWKESGFDDKDWKTIKTSEYWEKQGYENYDGYAWYRIHVNIPAGFRSNTFQQKKVLLYLPVIDNADETYLNGVKIGGMGSLPDTKEGYKSDAHRERYFYLDASHPAIQWGKDNVIAIKVYDAGVNGGISGVTPYLEMLDSTLQIGSPFTFEKDAIKKTISIHNTNAAVLKGELVVHLIQSGNATVRKEFIFSVRLSAGNGAMFNVQFPNLVEGKVVYKFLEEKSARKIVLSEGLPYSLTPLVADAPKINGATVYGVRPASPLIYKVPVSGKRPMQITVAGLPQGLSFNANMGVINGSVTKAGDYSLKIIARNNSGVDSLNFTIKVGNLLALTPPMGWNSWNCWGSDIDQTKTIGAADAMIKSGLADHGWNYINIDDGWADKERDSAGNIRFNSKFQNIKLTTDYIHSLGLKTGIYSSPGTLTCAKFTASFGYEEQDAKRFADWGFDLLKYDYCSYGNITPLSAPVADLKKPYEVMQQALGKQPRDIVYSLCQYGFGDVWKWGGDVNGNLWRTTGDIRDTWKSVSDIGFTQSAYTNYASPGRWNDPDMLVVGWVGWGPKLRPTRLTPDEQYAHVSLWAMLAAPLIIGCDLERLDKFTLNLLTNDEVIAINQDALGKAGKLVYEKDGCQVWTKELSDNRVAVGVFNLSSGYKNVAVDWKALNLPSNAILKNAWTQKDEGVVASKKEIGIPSHGVKLYVVKRN